MNMIRTKRPTRVLVLQDGPQWFVWNKRRWLCQDCADDDVFGRAHIADRQFGAAVRGGCIQGVPRPHACAACGLEFDAVTGADR